MMRCTHLVMGVCCSIPLIQQNPLHALGLLGSIFPDFDLMFGVKHHRTVTHSLLALFVTSVLLYSILNANSVGIVWVWMINYGLHLAADLLNYKGVPLLYPYKKRFALRLIKSKGLGEFLLLLSCIALCIAELFA